MARRSFKSVKIDYGSEPNYKIPTLESNYINSLNDIVRTKLSAEQIADRRYEQAWKERDQMLKTNIPWVSKKAEEEFRGALKNSNLDAESWQNVDFSNPTEVREHMIRLNTFMNDPGIKDLVIGNEYLLNLSSTYRDLALKKEMDEDSWNMAHQQLKTLVNDHYKDVPLLREVNPAQMISTDYFDKLADPKQYSAVNKYELQGDVKKKMLDDQGKEIITNETDWENSKVITITTTPSYDQKQIASNIMNKFSSDPSARRTFFNQAKMGSWGEALRDKDLSKDENYKAAVDSLALSIKNELEAPQMERIETYTEQGLEALNTKLKDLKRQSEIGEEYDRKTAAAQYDLLLAQRDKTLASIGGATGSSSWAAMLDPVMSKEKQSLFNGKGLFHTAFNKHYFDASMFSASPTGGFNANPDMDSAGLEIVNEKHLADFSERILRGAEYSGIPLEEKREFVNRYKNLLKLKTGTKFADRKPIAWDDANLDGVINTLYKKGSTINKFNIAGSGKDFLITRDKYGSGNVATYIGERDNIMALKNQMESTIDQTIAYINNPTIAEDMQMLSDPTIKQSVLNYLNEVKQSLYFKEHFSISVVDEKTGKQTTQSGSSLNIPVSNFNVVDSAIGNVFSVYQ